MTHWQHLDGQKRLFNKQTKNAIQEAGSSPKKVSNRYKL